MQNFFKKFSCFLLIFLVYLILPSTIFADVSKRRIFLDSFENGIGSWQLTYSSPNNIEVAADQVHTGSKSMKLNYRVGNNNATSALYTFCHALILSCEVGFTTTWVRQKVLDLV